MKAFPYIEQIGIQDVAGYKGMELRDYFAAKAMNGMIGGMWPTNKTDQENIAEFSYQMADAMIKARDTK
jgi:hypothetical protein